ncbi:hypothetical protein F2Q69_00033828, partial [Brassica cretica]
SELLLKIPDSYTLSVQIPLLSQETALTWPISEPFCLLSLLPTLPTPPDPRAPPSGNLPTESPDFTSAAEMSRRKFAVDASPLPSTREVTLYYEECMLRYSNGNILSTLNANGEFSMENTQSITSNLVKFTELVLSTMNQAATVASNSSRKFDTVNDFTDFQTLHGLVQCTPDLTSQDCLDCLSRIINQLPTDRIGGRVMVPSCFSRFELYLFYNEAAADRTPQPQLHSAPPPPPPISIPSPRPGDGGNSTVIAIAVVVPITVIFLLLVAVLIFRAKRKTTAYETEPLAVVSTDGDDIATAGSLQFDFKAIEAATGKFSQENKLGQGGFGQVYKNCTYSTSLRTLLSSLSSPNASYSTGFQSATVGQPPDRVTGLYLCRGDVTPEVCRRCVAFAVNETVTLCPNQREVTLYYEECMLRHSNGNILSTLNANGEFTMANPQKITSNLVRFTDLVLSTMNQAATVASNSSRKFDTINAYTDFQTLNGLVQCTPDLTSQDCLDCLSRIINQLPTDSIGGRVMVPSCFSRFELYLFYNEAAADRTPQPQLDSAPPPPPAISIPSPRPGESGNSTVIVIAVVVPITVIFLLLVAVFIFRSKRKTTAYETEPLAVVSTDGDDIATAGSLQFDFKAIEAATDKFSQENKLGQGGFGQVYKVLIHCLPISPYMLICYSLKIVHNII